MDGILSQEPTVARHALALALHLAQHNAPQLLESQKDLMSVVAATCSMYEASGEHCAALNSEVFRLGLSAPKMERAYSAGSCQVTPLLLERPQPLCRVCGGQRQ